MSNEFPRRAGVVQTVLGPIDPGAQLGVTLPHEHMFLDLRNPALEQDDQELRARLSVALMDDLPKTTEALAEFAEAGGESIVELTTPGMGRNVTKMVIASRAAGVNVVAATGYYTRDFHPAYVDEESVSQLTERMVTDVLVGMDGSDVKAGIIKLGSSCYPLTGNELKCFVSGAKAQAITRAPITTHTSFKVASALSSGTMGFEQLDVLERNGADLSRVIIGHLDMLLNLETLIGIARTGAFVEIDGIGSDRHTTDDARARHVAQLFEAGYGEQILLSHDLARITSFRSEGGGGYSFLLRNFLPLLSRYGLNEDALLQLIVRNPARALAFEPPGA